MPYLSHAERIRLTYAAAALIVAIILGVTVTAHQPDALEACRNTNLADATCLYTLR